MLYGIFEKELFNFATLMDMRAAKARKMK